MKILIVSQYFWPENFRINDLAVGLKANGHEVTVLTGIPNYPEGRFVAGYGIFKRRVEEYRGVKVLRVPLMPRGKANSWRLTLNYLSFALSASLLGPIRCRGKFDVIFVFETSPITVGIPAIVLKKLKRAPVLFWVLDLWPESLSATGAVRSSVILRMVGGLVRFIYRHCDRILVSSRAYSSSIKRMGGKSEQICYFPNWTEGVFQSESRDSGAIDRSKIPSGFKIMFAGNIGVAQDFANILAVAEKLKNYHDIHWMILGDGRMFDWVKNQVEERDLTATVHLLGHHPLDVMPHFFALADAMMVSLKRDPVFALTVPGKIQSYLASGKPIVGALDGEGGRLIAEAGAGLTCPAEDPAALAEAVLTMYKTPHAERQKMGLSGKRYSEVNFERTLLFAKLERWMQDVRRSD